jgi:hypothetical protein
MKVLISALIVLSASSAMAQEHRHKHAPYAGMHTRAVKALSDQDIGDLRSARGMGMALAAELNGYPGPIHVLEFAAQLDLSTDQRRRAEELYAAMKAEALPAGERLIEQETALDGQFRDRTITPESLATLTAQIGMTQGALRAIHLKYHLVTAELLTPEQSQRYQMLRGYRH